MSSSLVQVLGPFLRFIPPVDDATLPVVLPPALSRDSTLLGGEARWCWEVGASGLIVC